MLCRIQHEGFQDLLLEHCTEWGGTCAPSQLYTV